MRWAGVWMVGILGCGGGGGDEPGTDAGDAGDFRDAGPTADSGSPCAGDEDCDDGVFCNGAEACTRGACVPGVPVDCDDGLECTVDSCSEARRDCVSEGPDGDGDGHVDRGCGGDDCDDADPLRHVGADEVCDPEGRDEDCDPATFGVRDLDMDGSSDAACCNGSMCGDDCDDTRAAVHPGEADSCDGLDNDCDASVDEGGTTYLDCDGDGFGRPGVSRIGCEGPVVPGPECPAPVASSRWLGTAGDCDDTRASTHPGATESCDAIDDDCDPATPGTRDEDRDSHVDARCCNPLPGGAVACGTDCDDTRADTHPGAPELCDRVDNDCSIDPRAPSVVPGEDLDRDGHAPVMGGGCSGGLPSDDCADDAAWIAPGRTEDCDGYDEDCDGATDEMNVCNDVTASCGGSPCRPDCVGRSIETRNAEGVRTIRAWIFCRMPHDHAVHSSNRSCGIVTHQIRDVSENDWVRARASELGIGTMWLHATRAFGEFRWTLGSPLSTGYQNWAPGEPNDAGGNEDALMMYLDGRWNDAAPYGSSQGFGCVAVAR